MRHLVAAVVVSICVFIMVAPVAYLYHKHLPAWLNRAIQPPVFAEPETWRILAALAPAGLGLAAIAILASLRWRIRTLAVLAAVAMLGVLFIDRHMISRHARTRDGETMIKFARAAGKLVGKDNFAVYRAEKS